MSKEKNVYDQTQETSLELALKRSFTIIQGPPGTGKTFVGSRIIEMLLYAKRKFKAFKGPIFLVCYSNHALDQFLMHILDFTENCIRLGAQTKIEAIKK